jgi:hypothetical protein
VFVWSVVGGAQLLEVESSCKVEGGSGGRRGKGGLLYGALPVAQVTLQERSKLGILT